MSAPGRRRTSRRRLKADAKGLRIGLPKEYFGQGVSAEVRDAVHKAAAALEGAGATVEEVSLPHAEHALGAYYVIMSGRGQFQFGPLRRRPLRLPSRRGRRARYDGANPGAVGDGS